jgi:hypothetical protein
MRITRELLINVAREQTEKITLKDHSVQCAYLVGSLLRDEPFLGGITDIDLVYVHDRPVQKPREIIRLNAEVHLDIAHLTEEAFNPPRKLRTDAWIGGTLDKGPLVLYDRFHWFDFTRASAASQYWQTENVIKRARSFAAPARQAWQTLVDENPQGLKRTQLYLGALRDTANALAVYSGTPLTLRHFILDLPERINKIDIPEFTASFVAQFSNESIEAAHLEKWHSEWLAAYDAVKGLKETPVQYSPNRRIYYEKAMEVLAPDHPAAALWILLNTWTDLASLMPKTESLYKEWQSFIRALRLDSKGMPEHLVSLDTLLDLVESTIDSWQEENA